VLTVEYEITKTVTNEISLDIKTEGNAGIDVSLIYSIKAKIGANVSKQTGHVIGETITRRQTFKFSVKPGSFVIYGVLWKRNVRIGEYEISLNGSPTPIEYRAYFDLSYEIKSSI